MRMNAKWAMALCLGLAAGSVSADPKASSGSKTEPTFFVTVEPKEIQPGDTVTVQVYLKDAGQVSGYQAQLSVRAGEKGSFKLTGMQVDKNRPDFLFRDKRVIDTMAPTLGELFVVQFEGFTQAPKDKPVYLATYELKASEDASGAFRFNLQPGQSTFLVAPDSSSIVYRVGDPVEVRVGRATKPAKQTRSGKK